MSRDVMKSRQPQSQETTIVEEIELKETENETYKMKGNTVQQEAQRVQGAVAADAGVRPLPPRPTRRTTVNTSRVNVAATEKKEVVSFNRQPYRKPSVRNTGAMARAPEIDLRHLIKAGPSCKKVGITFNTIQTDVTLENQYRCYRQSVDKERSVQTLLKEVHGVDTSTSAQFSERSSKPKAQSSVKIPIETQTSKKTLSNVNIVENVVKQESKQFVTSGSSMRTLESHTDSLDREKIFEQFEEPCICQPGFPPRRGTPCTLSYIPERPHTFPMDYCTRFFFFLFFLIKCFIMLLIWLLLLYGFIRTCGFYFERLEVYENYNLNTYIDTDNGPKNYIINNSNPSVKLSVALDGPFKDDASYSKDYFYYQYERWYYFKNNYTPTALKRPDWPGEPLRYTITDQQQPTMWLVEVEHYSRIMTYQWTNLTTTASWSSFVYNEQKYYFTTYTRSSWTDFYRINYHARQRYRWYLMRKHRLYDYNYNRFNGLQELSYNFPNFKSVPGRSALYHDYRGTQPGPPKDVILANGTADKDLTFIYVFRYSINDVIQLRPPPNGTTARPPKVRRSFDEWKISQYENKPSEDQIEDKSKNESEDHSKKQSKRQANKTENVIVPFSLRLIRGTDKRYTTTTTTQPPPNKVEGSTGLQYLCGLISCALFLLLLQADLMSIIVLMAGATVAVVSYLEIREPIAMEKVMYDLEEVLMLIYFMLLVQFLADTGYYGFVAYYLRNLLKDYRLVATYLCACTAGITMLLASNVVTILLMTPLAIRCTEEFDFNPIPLLIMMIVYATQAGVLTPTSSYTNVRLWRTESNLPVNVLFKKKISFFSRVLPMYIVITVITSIYFAIICFALKPYRYKSERVAELTLQKELWHRMRSGISPLSTSNIQIRKEIDREIDLMNKKILREKNTKRDTLDDPVNRSPKEHSLRKPLLLLEIVLALLFFIIMQLLRFAEVCLNKDPETLVKSGCFSKISNTFVLWFSMGVLLILIRPRWNRTMSRIDWATLVSFGCLLLIQYLVSAINISEWLLISENANSPTTALTSSELTKMFWYASISAALLNSVVALTIWLEYATAMYLAIGATESVLDIFTVILTYTMNIGGSALLLGTLPAIACHNSAKQQGYSLGYFRYMLYALPITALNLGLLYLRCAMFKDEQMNLIINDGEG